MNFTSLKKHFHFSKAQRIGIIALLFSIIVFQFAYFFIDFNSFSNQSELESNWLSNQKEIDSEKLQIINFVPKVFPFNPNFIRTLKDIS